MADRIGQQLDNYRLLRLLGEGGFAEVYLGEHIYLGTYAAIKLLSTQVTKNDIRQFQREVHMLANLVHPHIVRVLDFGIDDRTPYLVMDYAPDGTLRTRHPNGTRLSLPTVVAYVKQFAQALQYAHDQKLIHRDVKPENMLIAHNGDLLLSDFGIALMVQSSRYQSLKNMAGTIAYMAPEQIEAHPRPASDQYSLGIVAYEWLSGDHPFQGSFREIAAKHSITPPPSLCQQLPTLSPEIEQIIFTALAKKPEDRFASVHTFAIALEQASRPGRIQPSINLMQATPLSQSEQNQPPAPPPVVTLPKQPLPSTILDPLPNRTAELTIEAFSQTPSSHVPKVPDTHLSISQLMGHPSRRTVIAGLVGLTLMGGGTTWLIVLHSLIPLGTRLYTYHGHSGWVSSVAWSPDGKRIASTSLDKTVQVWNAFDGRNVFTYHGHSDQVSSVAWSPDGKRIASASWDETVQVWNAVDGSHVFTYQGDYPGQVSSVAWSSDGKYIASAFFDGMVQVWNAVDGSHVSTYPEHFDKVDTVAWSPDGKRIASGSDDKTVQVWNALDGSNVFTYQGHSDKVDTVAWSPDGKRIASGSDDKTVQVWNAIDGSHVYTYKRHAAAVWSVAWSPDGKRIASGSWDKTVQVWNAVDGHDVYTYKGHVAAIWSVAWSPDGKRIASGSGDQTVQVWEAS